MKRLRRFPSGVVRATTEHMPFAGHRTVATVWAQQKAARKSPADREKIIERYYARLAKQFGVAS